MPWSRITRAEIVGKPVWLGCPDAGRPTLQTTIEAAIRGAAAGGTVREGHEMRGTGGVRAMWTFR